MFRGIYLLSQIGGLFAYKINERKLRQALREKGYTDGLIDGIIGGWAYLQLSEKQKKKIINRSPHKTRQQYEVELLTVIHLIFQDDDIARLLIT